jgi:hypothetical protein
MPLRAAPGGSGKGDNKGQGRVERLAGIHDEDHVHHFRQVGANDDGCGDGCRRKLKNRKNFGTREAGVRTPIGGMTSHRARSRATEMRRTE